MIIEGIGEVPDSWNSRRAKHILVRKRRPAKATDEVVTAFRDGRVTLRKNRRLEGFTEAVKEIGYQGLRVGDLVVHAMDGFAGAIGVSDSNGKASPVVHAYTSESADLRFVAYVLRDMARSGFVASLAKGIRERSTSFDPATLADLNIPIPPLDEQRRIADFLDAETARIDQLVSLRNWQFELVAERQFASVSAAFPVDGSVDMVRLGYLASIQSGVTVDSSRSTAGQVVTRPYLRVANVQAGHLELGSVTEITVPVSVARSSTLQPGDVLMTEGGDLDKLGRGTVWSGEIPNCLHQNHVFAVRPGDRLNPNYLALLTRTAYARSYFESTGSKSTNLASTSSGKIRNLRVPMVSLRRQVEIAERVNLDLKSGESLISLLKRQKRLLEERRRAVITAAVTGELDVTTARGV
ncbi:restriction endonuclease subunit S [Actinomadura violacea]|uniref:Restriction endonuclease subunit S n=1 Tax=Actinomadura violacea TaxID=2819934 RepID=A0ABS3RQH9_9ACTN|nr:restriction endonuclease subunit S [Actinomadura violacea]MBO2458558.1 restriction endonuclease subunit S [Actinomadura violacea]